MKCDNSFCIYEFKKHCTLDEISIDGMGFCSECILADVDEEHLTYAKLKVLKNFKDNDL